MRDVLAVAGVVILALCLGVTSAYLSVDLTPPGLELIRPPKPAIAEQIARENKQSAIQAQASECKYCIAVAELAQTFARHAKSARQHAVSLQTAMVLDKKAETREQELLTAERSADGAEAAAAALTNWASRCKAEDFCRASPMQASASSCISASETSSGAAALLLAAAVRKSARACAESSCPSVDCKATGALRDQVEFVERSLDRTGGRLSTVSVGVSAAQLPVGASTLKSELTRISDEAIYVTKMLPLMLDNASTRSKNGNLPQLASEMVDDRAVSASQLASVMEKAAAVGDSRSDPRYEAAWRLKALAANLSTLGKETQTASGRSINWQTATDSLGAALFDLARLQAMLDRVSNATPAGKSCDVSVPGAAQQLREAVAMLDLCRMRSACARRTNGPGLRSGVPDEVLASAQSAAEGLTVNELSNTDVVQASTEDAALQSPADFLREHQGVCVRAAELREANTSAPVVTQAVAEGVTSGLQAAAGPVAPQDLVSGAAEAAIHAEVPAPAAAPEVVQAAAPVAAEPEASEVIPASSPAQGTPTFSGSLGNPAASAFVGSDGAPVLTTEPAPAQLKKR